MYQALYLTENLLTAQISISVQSKFLNNHGCQYYMTNSITSYENNYKLASRARAKILITTHNPTNCLRGPLEAHLWISRVQGFCVCISHEGGEPGARNTVWSDKTDDKAERIDDKLLTALAHVFRSSLPAEIQIAVCLHTHTVGCLYNV